MVSTYWAGKWPIGCGYPAKHMGTGLRDWLMPPPGCCQVSLGWKLLSTDRSMHDVLLSLLRQNAWKKLKRGRVGLSLVEQAFNPGTQETDAGSVKSAPSTQ